MLIWARILGGLVSLAQAWAAWSERRAIASAERNRIEIESLRRLNEVKDAQAKAERDRPGTRLHLVKRMRDREF